MVVAELVERSLPIPEVRGLNTYSHQQKFIYIEHLFTVNCVLKRRNKEKRGREWPIIFLKNSNYLHLGPVECAMNQFGS